MFASHSVFKFHDSYDIKRVLDIQAEFLSGTDRTILRYNQQAEKDIHSRHWNIRFEKAIN